ncbi:MAG: hypothetical protein HKO62_12790 [Gammaproteobacteria bacterium]|nr:hypothetical protein [Gammaproteobacteria bacterium]
MTDSEPTLITSMNVREHFHDCLDTALRNQEVPASCEAQMYIVNLLTQFALADNVFEQTSHGRDIKALAFMYGDAVDASDPLAQRTTLKRLGDVALFISGLFSDSLNRKLVDIDYYIAMGGSAYSYLADSGRSDGYALGDVYAELADKFVAFVDVLAEIAETSSSSGDSDILRSYEIWLRTGSDRAARRLQAAGIVPSAAASSSAQH